MNKQTVIPMLVMLLTTLTLASVFVYYPLTMTAIPQEPSVVFQLGSNAGGPDIGKNYINVELGVNYASAEVEIHPTYRENYYKDVLRISNGDDNQMRVYIIFGKLENTLPKGSIVMMFIYDGTTEVLKLDITNPALNDPIPIGSIESGKTWQIDFYVYIPEGENIKEAQYSASATLVYTPSSETPPIKPSDGR